MQNQVSLGTSGLLNNNISSGRIYIDNTEILTSKKCQNCKAAKLLENDIRHFNRTKSLFYTLCALIRVPFLRP